MGSRIKEDERTEKAIRSLLKLPENRRCINCNSLGPQYVCSTFLTFVCINCSGIHREFTHRVKSISMAKFTAEEVNALRAGGNERARQIYLKERDTQREGYPDGSNILKLREFIRSVYVEKRYRNEKSLPSKPAVTEDYKGSKKTGTSIFGSRSLPSFDKYETERSSVGGRSGNETLKFYFEDKKHNPQQVPPPNPKSRGLPKSPIRFEIVDDRFRDDGSVKRYDMRRESRGNSKSLDLSDNKETSSLPIVRHASVNSVVKVENLGSLIDDVPPQIDENISRKTVEYPAPNSLEALLFGLSVPSAFSGTNNHPEANLGTHETSRAPESNVTSFESLLAASHTDDNLHTKDIAVASPANDQVESSTPPKEASSSCMELAIIDDSNPVHEVECEHETKSSIRNALPEDLFSFVSPQVHAHQHHDMGYGMQYYQYPVETTGAYTYTAKSSNPFDLSCDDDHHTSPNQAPQFLSMAYEQGGGLPLVPFQSGFSDSSSLAEDYNGLGLMTSQSHSYAPSFGRQEMNGLNIGETTYNNALTFHQANIGYPSTNPNGYVSRGNPFE